MVGHNASLDQEKDKTLIRGGKVCKKILGFDANALYLGAIGGNMPCGEHQIVQVYEGLLDDIVSGEFFGMIECDVKVPKHLESYFSEMCPIFKNVSVTYKDISTETKNQVLPNYNSRKLIGSMFGQKMLFHSDLLQWYLKKGIEVSNISLASDTKGKHHSKCL